MQICGEIPIRKSEPKKHRKRKKEEDLLYDKPFTDITENSHKTRKECSTWRRYFTSSDNKKTTSGDAEVPARHV